eukprot:179399-Hanusia_phi.AAC.2
MQRNHSQQMATLQVRGRREGVKEGEEGGEKKEQQAAAATSSSNKQQRLQIQQHRLTLLQGNLAVINAELEYLREKEETRRQALLSSVDKSREARSSPQQQDSSRTAGEGTIPARLPSQLSSSPLVPADSQLGRVLERYLTPSQLGNREGGVGELRKSQMGMQTPASAQLDKYLKKSWE